MNFSEYLGTNYIRYLLKIMNKHRERNWPEIRSEVGLRRSENLRAKRRRIRDLRELSLWTVRSNGRSYSDSNYVCKYNCREVVSEWMVMVLGRADRNLHQRWFGQCGQRPHQALNYLCWLLLPVDMVTKFVWPLIW